MLFNSEPLFLPSYNLERTYATSLTQPTKNMPPPYINNALLPAALTAFACVFGGVPWAALTALLLALFMFGLEASPWCVLVCFTTACGAFIAGWLGAAGATFIFISQCPHELRPWYRKYLGTSEDADRYRRGNGAAGYGYNQWTWSM